MHTYTKHILLVIGLTFLVFVPLWTFAIGPRLTQMPKDFAYTADLVSEDNFYDQASQTFIGATQSQSTFSYKTVQVQPGVLTIQNTFDAQSSAGQSIIHIDRLYGINPTTRRHVQGFGDHDRIGYLFAPTHLQKGQEFTYWHVNYDVPAEMHYKESEVIDGLETYHYQATLTPDQTENLSNLPHVGETLGINLDVALDMWVEPATGRMVKYADKAVAYYYDLVSGERLYPWNAFSNTFTEDSVLQQAYYAQQTRWVMLFIERIMPVIFFVLYILCIIPLLMSWFPAVLRFVRRSAPWVVSGVGIGVTMVLYFFVTGVLRWQQLTAFQHDTQHMVEAIQEQMGNGRNTLEGGKSFFASNDEVTSDEWKSYVAGLQMQTQHSAMQGMGYVNVMHTANGEVQAPVTYIEPLDDINRQALGVDMYLNPSSKAAMDLARDSGAPIATGKVALTQSSTNDDQHGFILYFPFYGATEQYTVVDRRSALRGFVYAPFQMKDVMQVVFGSQQLQYDMSLYDDAIGENADGLLYSTVSVPLVSGFSSDTPQLTRRVFIFGHRWKIVFAEKSDQDYSTIFERIARVGTLLVGGIFSILLGILVYLSERGYLKRPLRRRS